MQAEHSFCLLVGWPLPDLAAEGDVAGSSGCETRLHPLADVILAERTRNSCAAPSGQVSNMFSLAVLQVAEQERLIGDRGGVARSC
jgi:hypothetical protein